MDFDLNQEFGGEILVADVVPVNEVVENRVIHEWDLNMDASSLVDNGEIELGVDREGELEVDSWLLLLSMGCELLLIVDCVGLHDSLCWSVTNGL